MKKILYLLAACACLAFTSCQNEKDLDINTYDGKGLEFVHFAAASDNWLVAEGDESYDFNVVIGCTYAHESAVTYNITVGDKTTGVEGVDFSIPTKSVTIPAGQYLGELPVTVLYETTGLSFDLELILDVEDSKINDAYGASSLISVKSDKVTIDWEWLEGNWTAQDLSGGDPYVMAITKVDETHAIFTNIWGMGADMEGVVDFENRVVAFQGPFNLGPVYDGSLMVAHINEETGAYDDGIFYAVLSPLGITISGMGYYLVGGPYDGYDFGEDATVLTR